MTTHNYQYTDDLSALTNFIIDHKIKDCENILLQIFSGVCDVNYISTLIEDIKNIVPNIHIIGTTTVGEISSGKSYNESVTLSFSLFDNTKIKSFLPDFKATISFKPGITETVKWFEEKKERMKIIEANNHFMDRVISAYLKLYD